MYVDGKLVLQDHSLRHDYVLSAIGIESETLEASYDWLDSVGHFPDNLEDVKLN